MHKVQFALALATSASAVWLYATALDDVFTLKSETKIAKSYGGHLQFLTILGVVTSLLQQIASVLALLTGLRVLRSVQNVLLIISAPLETVISALYWPIKLYNPLLLIDRSVSVPISPSLDRRVHMYPALVQFLSATVFAQKKWHRNVIGFPLAVILSMAGAYWYWFETTAAVNGFYPYPFLGALSTEQKGLLVGTAVLVALTAYKVIESVQRSLR